jgi:hypothetical protein
VTRDRQPACWAVRRRWQFAHRRSHFAISSTIVGQPAPAKHDADIHPLLRSVHVIELKKADIGLAAVDAWVGAQVFVEQSNVLFPTLLHLRPRSSDVRSAIPSVVITSVLRLAWTAVAMAFASLSVAERELVKRLSLPACVAKPQLTDTPDRELFDHRSSR